MLTVTDVNGTSSTPSMCTQRPRSTHTSRTSAVLPAISNVFVVLFRTKPRVWVMTPSACSGRITFFRFLFFSKFSMPNTCNQGLRSRLIPSPQVKTVFLPSALCTLRFDGHPHLAMDVTASAVSARMSRFCTMSSSVLLPHAALIFSFHRPHLQLPPPQLQAPPRYPLVSVRSVLVVVEGPPRSCDWHFA